MHGLMLWAQVGPVNDLNPPDWLQWLWVIGEPSYANGRVFEGPLGWLPTWLLGGFLSWAKVVGLFCLLAWVAGLLFRRAPDATAARRSRSRMQLYLTGVVLVMALGAALLGVMEQTGRLRLMAWGPYKPATWLGFLAGAVFLGLVEWRVWAGLDRKGDAADKVVLVGVHLALALGFLVSYLLYQQGVKLVARRIIKIEQLPEWRAIGGRMGATFMGLVVFARVAASVLVEVSKVRFRRIYAIAWQSVVEANRRMWAPWVVLSVFVVILAFTHWFLRANDDRGAELSKMFVGTLTLLTSLLVILMVGIISPIGMPHDIQTQTIYTVVSKPVRRLELIWGRLVGYMVLVSVLLGLFGGASLLYLRRTIGSQVDVLKAQAKEFQVSKPGFAKQKAADADQLLTRMSARVPLKGSLLFVDSKRKEHRRGIDVGQEQDVRSHIEGATPSKAVWSFGLVPDPWDPKRTIDLRIPVASLLTEDTIEGVEDKLINLKDAQSSAATANQDQLKGSDVTRAASEGKTRSAEVADLEKQLKALKDQEQGLRLKSRTVPKAEGDKMREDAAKLHSKPIPIEMTFNIYRTTKGVLGEPVLASMVVTNPRPGSKPHPDLFPIHEYYTNKRSIPASVLVGSHGFLKIEVRCVTPNQYLGMAEGDLYILASQGGFEVNFLKGLFGIWLQAMVLTAIGLFAGTFLSWPVALLTTIAFFLFGELAFQFLALFSMQLEGGGPFESMIRILNHQNMMNPLAATPSVIVAKTLDVIVMPVMGRLVYLIPNFAALDVTNTVADGFAVRWSEIGNLLMLGLGYALPFSIAGYFILKNREVAA